MSTINQCFGWGKWRPKSLQCFCSAKWALFWISFGGLIQGVIVNGFVNMSISTIEKRYGFKSRQIGFIISAYNIASFFCLVPVSFYGGLPDASKPKWLASGVLLMGLGSALFSIPHFLFGTYHIPTNLESMCPKNIELVCGSLEQKSYYSWPFWIFFLGQLFHGAGATPLFTLGVTYLDENIERNASAMYLGVFYGMTIVGPAVGFLIGSQLLKIYVDFLTVDTAKIGLSINSHTWVGAWWIGFTLSSVFAFLVAIPLYGLPKTLPDYELVQRTKILETHKSTVNRSDSNTAAKPILLRQLPKYVFELVKNPAFLFLAFTGCCEGLLISSFTSFTPKEIESQYNVSASTAALLIGIIAIPAAGGGILLGGYLTTRFNPSCSTILKICIYAIITSCLLTPSLLLKCPNSKFAGVNAPYKWGNKSSKFSDINLITECNKECGCNSMEYFPLCGIDNVVYYSPCHAGCRKHYYKNYLQYYSNCSCIDKFSNMCNCDYEAINTKCNPTCNNLPYFLFLWFFAMLSTFLITVPALSASLRVVHFEQRSLGLGIQWILVRLCGTIPGPILFGTIIDFGCILWQETCLDNSGSCLAYDNSFLSLYLWIIAFIVKMISIFMAFMSWYLYVPPSTTETS